MTTTIQAQNRIVGSGYAITLAQSDALIVTGGIVVGSTDGAAGAVMGAADATIDLDGTLAGGVGIQSAQGSVTIGATGTIRASVSGIVTYQNCDIVNYGQIAGGDYGITFRSSRPYTSISLLNAGTITSSGFAFNQSFGSDRIVNTGTITGDIQLGSFGSSLDSSQGRIFGTIYTGSTGDRITAALNGGRVIGNTGHDVLTANLSQASADAHAHFSLDGAGGSNILTGGGAFNTFVAGDADGGRNQINGGLSLMGDVSGYHNNTIDFGLVPIGQGVYVDLLQGHNAYLMSNGTYTLEDSIHNVPNVIGTISRDVIRCDDTGDTVQGGTGGDTLILGAGADALVYSGYADSNLVGGHDTVQGFKSGIDKLDFSALGSSASHLVIRSGAAATALYLEATPGKFSAATDLAISFAGANAVKATDVIF